MSEKSWTIATFAPTKNNKMKRNIIIYGLIAGIVVSVLMLFNVHSLSFSDGKFNHDKGLVIGYVTMLIAFSLVYVGIRNYRNNYNNGVISFGKAFKIGILMVLIASTIYVAAWLVDYYLFSSDFMEQYSTAMLDELKASGASAAEIDKETKEMANFVTMLKNPFFHALMTYAEILPVGLVVTLISSLILKRKPVKN